MFVMETNLVLFYETRHLRYTLLLKVAPRLSKNQRFAVVADRASKIMNASRIKRKLVLSCIFHLYFFCD